MKKAKGFTADVFKALPLHTNGVVSFYLLRAANGNDRAVLRCVAMKVF